MFKFLFKTNRLFVFILKENNCLAFKILPVLGVFNEEVEK